MEHFPEDNPEQEPRLALEALPAVLGYVESAEMIELSQRLVETMQAGENTSALALQYRLMAEQMTEGEGKGSSRLRAGMLISIALMRRDGGRYDDYLEDLEDVLMMAEQEGLEDIALVLAEVLNY